jgi:hypothetical protein
LLSTRRYAKQNIMGLIHPGVPQNLVVRLAKEFNIATFVETGTHKGNTAVWAGEVFPKVVTIEASKLWHEKISERLAGLSNVRALLGASVEVLPGVVAELSAPALFWLDAHWSGRQTAGADAQCPLLGEIAAINASSLDHFILIDDARLFLSPPEPPHDVDQWPEIGAILAALNAARPKYAVVFEDAIIAVPPAARRLLQAYCLEKLAAVKNRSFLEKAVAKVRRVAG